MVLFSVLLLGPTLARESTICQGPGVTYTGTVNETKSGRTCQNWNESVPQRHTYTNVGDHNYCRNPTKKSEVGVWCYTTTKWIRWEKCNVPLCEESTTTTATTTTTTIETITTVTAVGTTEPAGSELCRTNTAKFIFHSKFDYTCHHRQLDVAIYPCSYRWWIDPLHCKGHLWGEVISKIFSHEWCA